LYLIFENYRLVTVLSDYTRAIGAILGWETFRNLINLQQ